ncbi:MAG: hypothetical protein CSA05_02690 [Bacteroidia bacterium]|nr:MAG: hypothetical protein CSA05_02690 [Bacteroidia bacterium]
MLLHSFFLQNNGGGYFTHCQTVRKTSRSFKKNSNEEKAQIQTLKNLPYQYFFSSNPKKNVSFSSRCLPTEQPNIQQLKPQKKNLAQQQIYPKVIQGNEVNIFIVLIVVILILLRIHDVRLRNRTNKKLMEKNKEIEKQRDELQKINATKDKFFSIISHDLRNPFTSLIGSSELLLKQYHKLSENQREKFVQSIYNTSQQAYKLLLNLLEWSRTQTGAIKFNPEIKDFNIIVKENFLLQQEEAKKKKIELKADLSSHFLVYIDVNMISTALRNITSNAIKFTNPGGEIQIQTEDKGKYIMVSVSDTGVGIKEEHIGKLFRIDMHHSTEGTSKEKGTGMGLILSKEFIEKNGGSIEIKSSPGEGTSISFTLPKASQN